MDIYYKSKYLGEAIKLTDAALCSATFVNRLVIGTSKSLMEKHGFWKSQACYFLNYLKNENLIDSGQHLEITLTPEALKRIDGKL